MSHTLPVLSSRPMTTAPAADPPDLRFDQVRGVVDAVLRDIARRHRLAAGELDDFAATAYLRIVEDDYAVLRRYEGRSRLSTYLRVVMTRWWLDDRIRAWGRWRPSAEAVRLGPTAVALERCLERQRLSLDEAIQVLRAGDDSLAESALREIAGRLPHRVTGRWFVDDSQLHLRPSPEPGADHLVSTADAARRAACVARLVRDEVAALPPRMRLVLRLRFERGATVAEIARVLGEPQKPLYRRLERVLLRLRERLEANGVSRADLGCLGDVADSFWADSETTGETGAARPSDLESGPDSSGRGVEAHAKPTTR